MLIDNLDNDDFFVYVDVTPTVTPTISVTPTVTPTRSVTPTVTPTISITPSITPTTPIISLFQDCRNNAYKVRFSSFDLFFNVGEVYEINGNGFHFFGRVISYANEGTLYSSSGVVFTGPYNICPSFCISNEYDLLNGFSGNYKSGGTYNSKIYYSGGTGDFVYFNGDEWCLSSSLGGDCVVNGKSPCFSETPDFNSSIIYSGYCVTPTPSISNQPNINFDAIFSCNIEVTPTPTITKTPTPTRTLSATPSVSRIYTNINLSASAYTLNVIVTPTVTPSISPTEPIQILGAVTFNMLENRFSRNAGFKVLRDCLTNQYYYTSQDLIYYGQPILPGQTIKVVVQGRIVCFTYIKDDTNGISNLFFDVILGIMDSCDSCGIPVTPTVTLTPSITMEISQFIEPTPSLSSNIVFIFESCSIISPSIKKTHLVQNKPYNQLLNVGDVVKDFNLNCWIFLGSYNSSYIPGTNFLILRYDGNYFNNYESNIYINCQTCLNG